MSDSAIHIHVLMDAKIFYDFAIFESLRLPHRWRKLLLFTLVMLAFAVVNLLTDAALLFWIFLAIGIVAPVAYLVSFRSSVNKQIARFGLRQPKQVYTVRFSREEEQITVKLPDATTCTFLWKEIHGVFRTADYVYLYTTPKQVYILPLDQVKSSTPDALWNLCVDCAPAEKVRDMRSNKRRGSHCLF